MKKWLVLMLICASTFVVPGGVRAQKAPAHESPHKKLKRSCEVCHVATSFRDIRFDHGETGYELSGPHSGLNCLECHNVEDFSRVERFCGTCHQDIHRSRLGADCQRCHSVEGWTIFDAEAIHENTNFPVQGRHLLLDCLACHPGMPAADFRRAWTGCYDCHAAEYEGAASPNHRDAQFPVVCQTCHEMTGWRPAGFPDHEPFFPIYSGTHNNQWNECVECHVVPGNFRVFECIECHAHQQSGTDSEHSGIPGYAYSSPACYSCHPTGEAGEFREHDTLYFPIYSGRHGGSWNSCADCHPSSADRKEFTCISCHDHRQTLMDQVHQGEVGDYRYNSAACYDCHPNGRAEDD